MWHENSSDNVYDNQGNVIGAKKLFCFKVKEGSSMMKSDWIMHEFSLVGETNWVLCTVHKKIPESKSGLERRFEDQSCIGDHVPATIVPLEIVTPQPWIDTDVLLLGDGFHSQQRKRMCCDVVEHDGPQATKTPAEYPFEFVMPMFEFTLS